MVLSDSTKKLLIVLGVFSLAFAGIQGYRMYDERVQVAQFEAMLEETYKKNPGLKEEIEKSQELLRKYGPLAMESGFIDKNEMGEPTQKVVKLEDDREKIVLSYPDDNYSEEFFLKDGKLEGTHKVWNKEGVLLNEAHYVDNKPSGINRSYYPDGALKSEMPYVNGVKQGTFKYWYNDGKLIQETVFKNDKVISEISYYLNGNIRMKEALDEDTGLLKTEARYPDGALSHTFSSKSRKYEGKLIKKDPKGALVAEANYKNGKLDGRCRTWDEEGELEVDLYYINGLIDKSNNRNLGDVCIIDIWSYGFR